MALPFFSAKKPTAPPMRRWWLSFYPRLSAKSKRSLLLLSLAAGLLVNSQWQIMNRGRSAQGSSADSPYTIPAVQNALYQLNLPPRDPIGDQFQVNTYLTGHQQRPAVALDSNGDFVVVWHSDGSSGSDTSSLSIQAQRYDSAGTAQGFQFQVNSDTGSGQARPAVAVDSDGDFVVVWDSNDINGSDTEISIQGQRYNSAGMAQGSQFQINSYTTGDRVRPAVALDSDGDFVVVWESNGSSGGDTSLYSIQGQRYNSAGTAQGSQFQVNGYTTNQQRYPSVSMDSNGDFVVVWQSNGSSGSDNNFSSIQAQRYNSVGITQGSQFQVNSYTTNSQQFPAVALDNDGDFIVVWDSGGSSGGDSSLYSIQGQRYNSAGTAQGSQFQINTYTTGSQFYSAVSLDSDGDFVVVWQSNGSSNGDTDSYSIQGQSYNSAGIAQGLQFQINSYTTLQQANPAVALDNDGDFVVVWDSNGSSGGDTSSLSIQGQRFTAVEPTLTPTPTSTPIATPTNTPGPTPTPSPTPSPGPSPTATSTTASSAYLPIIVGDEFAYFQGPCEDEPNDTAAEANGPLRSDQNYCADPDDERDYFSVYLFNPGTVEADLTNNTGQGVQLQLFYQTTANRVDFDSGPGALHVEHTGAAGFYYVLVFTASGHNSTDYSLIVNYP